MAVVNQAHEKPETVLVAAIQCSAEFAATQANSDKLEALVREAAQHGAKIIVLPEAAISGSVSQDFQCNWHVPGRPLRQGFVGVDPHDHSETVPGPSTNRFAALAKELQIYLTVPLLEVERSDVARPPRYYNTVCLVSPAGEIAAHYRKLNPWPYTENAWATRGDRGIQVVDTEYGRVGLAICYDIHTILPQYQAKKLWALLFSTAWIDVEHPADWFWHQFPAWAKQYNHAIIAANWSVDAEPERFRGYGFSSIIDSNGKVLASAKSLYGSEIVYATLQVAP